MKYFLPFIRVLCSVLLFLLFGNIAAAESLDIAYPPSRAIVESESINIVLKKWPAAVDELRFSINGQEPVDIKKTAKPAVHPCYNGKHLSLGMNLITVTAFQNGKKTMESTRPVFFRFALAANSVSAPPEFKKYAFHTNDNEKQCSHCHNLDFRKTEEIPDAPDRSPCYQCHKNMLRGYKTVHDPSASWSCLTCHDGKAQNPKLAVLRPDEKSCGICHVDIKENKKYIHAPTAAGFCATCHNPHATDQPFLLRRAPVALCTSCHPEILTQPHVLDFFSSNRGHPVQKSPDPFNPGKDLTCISCHNPHGSNSPVFLITGGDTLDMFGFCQSCHRM